MLELELRLAVLLELELELELYVPGLLSFSGFVSFASQKSSRSEFSSSLSLV